MARRKELDGWPDPSPARLRAARDRAGLTQVALAARAGVSPTTVSHWEQGQLGIIDPDIAARLASALGLDPARILEPSRRKSRKCAA